MALAVAWVLGFTSPVAAQATAPGVRCSAVDPIRLYGSEAYFEVQRNQTPVGFHRITFTRRDDQLVVNAEFHLEITFLGVTVYRYDYRSEEIWRNGCLQWVEAKNYLLLSI